MPAPGISKHKRTFMKFVNNAFRQRYLDERELLNVQLLLGHFCIPDEAIQRGKTFWYDASGIKSMCAISIQITLQCVDNGADLVPVLVKSARNIIDLETNYDGMLNGLLTYVGHEDLVGSSYPQFEAIIKTERREFADRAAHELWRLTDIAPDINTNAVEALNRLAAYAYAYWDAQRWKRMHGIDPHSEDDDAYERFDDTVDLLFQMIDAPDKTKAKVPRTVGEAVQALADAYSYGTPPFGIRPNYDELHSRRLPTGHE